MYVAYKLLQNLFMPELWILACLVTALVLSYWPRHLVKTRLLLFLGIGLFYVLGIAPTSRALMYPMKMAATVDPRDRYDAIVVLSAGLALDPQGHPTLIGTESLDRTMCGVQLYRQELAPKLVLAGGVGDPFGNQTTPEAVLMRQVAMEMGTAPDAIVTETRSRTTAESAVETRQDLGALRHIVLVSSPRHLFRAKRLYQAQGFDVAVFPCPYSQRPSQWSVTDLIPDAARFGTIHNILHEYGGLLASSTVADRIVPGENPKGDY